MQSNQRLPEVKSDAMENLRSIFQLPWIYDSNNWKMDNRSIELFNQGRDGQGFSAFVYVESDTRTNQPQKLSYILHLMVKMD